MSEKGKNPSERSKGSARKSQKEQELRPELAAGEEEGSEEQAEELLLEKERKPNRP
ncbi:MAG: hypothetical protein ACM3S5_06320 [Rhodospirillales bacterium]